MRNIHRGIVMRKESPKQGEDWFRITNKKNSDTTHVYIYDEIGFWGTTAADFAVQLAAIDTKNIHLHVNSPGGEVMDGIAIYNAIQTHDAYVTTTVDALAASAAAFIATAGDKLVMTRNATLMIHDAIGFCYGNANDMAETRKLLDRVSNNIADMFTVKAGGEVQDWRAMMQAETWYSASEAVDAGLADEVLDTTDDAAEAATNKWNLDIFNYAGRKVAPSPIVQRMMIANKIEETSMGVKAPTNTGVTDPAPEPGATEPDETTDPPAADPPAADPPAAPAAPAAAPAAPVENRAPVNFVINGLPVTDGTAVQNHITSLETFRKETIKDSRSEFVKNLARNNQIAATQIDKLTEFVNDPDTTDKQYDMWKASYESAPASPLFDNHGSSPADGGRPDNSAGVDKVEDRINVLKAIIADHVRNGVSQEKLEMKDSYKELQRLEASQTK